MALKDIPVRKKLSIIYFAGVLLPLGIINILLISRFQRTLNEQYWSDNRAFMERAAAQVSSVIGNGQYVLQKFYSDRGIYRILDTEYSSNREFVDIYNDLFNSTVLSFLPFYDDISSFILYTTNPTILNGGSLRFANERIRGEDWYIDASSPQTASVIAWIGSNQEDNRRDLHISIIHPLNYYASFDKFYNIMKVDLKLSSLEQIYEGLPPGAVLSLRDGNGREVLSSPPQDIAYSPGWKGNYEISRTLDNTGSSPWVLYGRFPVKTTGRKLLPSEWILPVTGFILMINSSLLIYGVSRSMTVRLNRLTGHIRNQESERMTILDRGAEGPGKDEIGELIESFNQLSRRNNQLVHDVYVSELARRETVVERQKAELYALQSQVNPHYLFNILETIRMKSVLKGEDETAEILQLLSSSFRRMFTWGEDLIPLKDSLRFLEEYLAIQRYRLGDRLEYDIKCDESLKSHHVPKFILQPIVENSCRHGFKGEDGIYRLNIYVERMGENLQFTVEDNGSGMDETLTGEILRALDTGEAIDRFVGLRNVRSRLRARYGEGLFQIISRPGAGTRVIFQTGEEKRGE